MNCIKNLSDYNQLVKNVDQMLHLVSYYNFSKFTNGIKDDAFYYLLSLFYIS